MCVRVCIGADFWGPTGSRPSIFWPWGSSSPDAMQNSYFVPSEQNAIVYFTHSCVLERVAPQKPKKPWAGGLKTLPRPLSRLGSWHTSPTPLASRSSGSGRAPLIFRRLFVCDYHFVCKLSDDLLTGNIRNDNGPVGIQDMTGNYHTSVMVLKLPRKNTCHINPVRLSV